MQDGQPAGFSSGWWGLENKKDATKIGIHKQFTTLPISQIIPYDNNPRLNDDAVSDVAASIDQLDYIDPIEVDENGVILSGHTRHKALKRLGVETADVLVVSGLTEKQKRKYRILTNKTAEKAAWDDDLLLSELDGLDFGDFDFGFDLSPDDSQLESATQSPKEKSFMRTIHTYNMDLFSFDACEGKFEMPTLEPVRFVPEKLVPFHTITLGRPVKGAVHFYMDDYKFECVWTSPDRYLNTFCQCDAIITPDYSMYMDMPYAMKLWNKFRSMLLGQYYQSFGITVIPNASFAGEDTWDFCFDGLPENSVLCVSSVGVKRSKESTAIWKAGVDELIRRKHPSTLIVYGGKMEHDFHGTKTVVFENSVVDRIKKG